VKRVRDVRQKESGKEKESIGGLKAKMNIDQSLFFWKNEVFLRGFSKR
jgi:hypothetical protein